MPLHAGHQMPLVGEQIAMLPQRGQVQVRLPKLYLKGASSGGTRVELVVFNDCRHLGLAFLGWFVANSQGVHRSRQRRRGRRRPQAPTASSAWSLAGLALRCPDGGTCHS